MRKFLFFHATVPEWRFAYHPTAFEDTRRWAPVVSIAVAGGPGSIGFVCPPFGHAVSRLIRE